MKNTNTNIEIRVPAQQRPTGSGEMVSAPLPPGLDPLPPLLTFGEAVAVLEFWNLGSRDYARDLRAIGRLASVNEWADGQRARYAAAAVLELYPLAGTAPYQSLANRGEPG